jgi:hypothetical protein
MLVKVEQLLNYMINYIKDVTVHKVNTSFVIVRNVNTKLTLHPTYPSDLPTVSSRNGFTNLQKISMYNQQYIVV